MERLSVAIADLTAAVDSLARSSALVGAAGSSETNQIAYSLQEAATKLGMSVDTVRRAYRDGELVFRWRGGKYYVEHSELVRWVRSWDAPPPY
ncbi:helix-turn-helix domain-containing protein [Gordonia tangerina]|uniref:helix-turn-helix domain-containing protein n=1 Tax=Gordonia tangerina TaxID=2911060 RepID=UPI003558150C